MKEMKELQVFGADWCYACNVLKRKLKELEIENPQVKFIYLDVDDYPELAKKYQIKHVPTTIFKENGKEIDRIDELDLKKIKEFINA